ncbi:MAG: phage/plasmid primase, P4 family [Planctomycetaceae bacterium]
MEHRHSGEWRHKANKIDSPKEADCILGEHFETINETVRKPTLKYWRDGFHHWHEGAWRLLESGAMLQIVSGHLGAKFEGVGNSHIANVTSFLKGKCFLNGAIAQNTWFNDVDRGPRIAVENGLIDPETGTLEPDTPDWFSRVKLPVVHDPAATCDQWMKTLFVNLECDTERIAILQEFTGYLLWPRLTFQKYLTLLGEGGNGKSVFIAGLQALLGRPNTSNYSLKSLGDNRFAAGGTIGKLANLCADISEINKVCEGVLKQLVSGDVITIDRKHQSMLDVTPTAKLVFSANNLPRFTDRSSGMTRRMIIVPFNRTVPEDEKVLDMDKPEFWMSELPGILNWALEGLVRLRQKNGFTDSVETREAAEEYRLDHNPAAVFIEERLVVNEDPNSWVLKSDVYRSYRDWCTSHGRKPLGDAEFGKEVRRALNVKDGRQRIDGVRQRVYYMLKLIRDSTFTF